MTTGTLFDDPRQVERALAQQQTVCSDGVANALSKIGRIQKCEKGEIVARQGDLGDELFYILSGSVSVVINEHVYRVRDRGEMIGEMAVIEPGERRSADLVCNQDDTILFVVRANDFLDEAKVNGQIWECVARELAKRLRQRDEMFVPPNPMPVVFIASSTEGEGIMNRADAYLRAPYREIRPWNKQGIFRPTRNILEELERQTREVDFAVVIVTADDLRVSRGKTTFVPRDNVLLEFGLFMGGLERERAFILAARDSDLALATDLDGITVLYFGDDDELTERLEEVAETIRRKGRMFRYCKVL